LEPVFEAVQVLKAGGCRVREVHLGKFSLCQKTERKSSVGRSNRFAWRTPRFCLVDILQHCVTFNALHDQAAIAGITAGYGVA